jgi:DNA-binding HxlR family transcriptional regulator
MTMPLDIRCSIAGALGEIGERWSLLIIREAIMGSTRFDEFHDRLGVARNILTERLATLVAHGVMTKTPSQNNLRIFHYELTTKGSEIMPVLAALMHWGDKWVHAEIGAPIVLVDRLSRNPIQKMVMTTREGKTLERKDIDILAGPGATKMMQTRLKNRLANQPA